MAQLHSQGKAELYFGAVEQECSLKHYEENVALLPRQSQLIAKLFLNEQQQN